jgi:hypothetical protein
METVRDCLSLRHILPLLSLSSSSAPRSSQIIGSAASRAEEPLAPFALSLSSSVETGLCAIPYFTSLLEDFSSNLLDTAGVNWLVGERTCPTQISSVRRFVLVAHSQDLSPRRDLKRSSSPRSIEPGYKSFWHISWDVSFLYFSSWDAHLKSTDGYLGIQPIPAFGPIAANRSTNNRHHQSNWSTPIYVKISQEIAVQKLLHICHTSELSSSG